MTRAGAKHIVSDFVHLQNGCKASELYTLRELTPVVADLPEIIHTLVEERALIEVEYMLAGATKCRSFLLPGNAQVTVYEKDGVLLER